MKTATCLAGALLLVSLAAGPVAADTIPLFNTGQDVVAGFDQRYTLQISAVPGSALEVSPWTLPSPGDLSVPVAAPLVTPHPAWHVASADSAWLGLLGVDHTGSEYVYTTYFDLTGLDPATAEIIGHVYADNAVAVFLNGVYQDQIVMAHPGDGYPFTHGLAFHLTDGFLSGENTLQFLVRNLGVPGLANNPTGLLVTLGGTADPVPEPVSLLLWGAVGLAGWGLRKRFV